jgi:putative membrane protein
VSKSDFSEKRRLHPISAVVGATKAFWNLAPFVIVALIGGEGDIVGPLASGIAVGAIALVTGVLNWIRFRYWIEEGEFRVTRGAFIHREVHIPMDHIQAIDVTVGIVQRAFGLVKLEVKSAAAGTQVSLSAISRQEAEALEEVLRSVAELEGAEATRDDEPGNEWRLTGRELLLAGATSGKLGVVFGGIAWLLSQLVEVITDFITVNVPIEQLDEGHLETSLEAIDPLLVAAVVAGGLLAAWLVSVLWEAVTIGRFVVRRRNERLVIRKGLVEQTEVTLPVSRVQAVRIRESLLRRPFGYVTVYVDAVGHAEQKGQSTILHPFLRRDRVEPLLHDLLPFLVGEVELVRPPRRALFRFAFKPTAVVAAGAIVTGFFVPEAFAALLLILPIGALAWSRWRHTGVGFAGGLARIRSGGLLRTTAIFERRRIQAAEVASSWFQRRRDLATFGATVAAGASGLKHTAPNIDRRTAEGLLDAAGEMSRKAQEESMVVDVQPNPDDVIRRNSVGQFES